MSVINTMTKDEFKKNATNSDKVVLVDFWAEWCPPCRAMAPILHQVGDEMDRQVDIVKVDIESGVDNANLAGQYEVRSIPNMILFKNGKPVDTLIGAMPKLALEDALKKHL